MRGVLLTIVIVLLPATGSAKSAVERVAARASMAHDTYCAEVAGTANDGDAAQALVEVGGAWAEVARLQEATGTEWLLYWVGVLAQCLSQDDRAAQALVEFLESDTATEGLAAMEQDARKRLMRLRPDYVAPKPSEPERAPTTPDQRRRSGQIAGGVVLAIGAAGAGAGSGAGFAGLSETRSTAEASPHPTAQADALIAQGNGQMAAGVGFAVGAGVAAVAAIAVLASGGSGAAEVALMPVPLPGGVGLALGGRW